MGVRKRGEVKAGLTKSVLAVTVAAVQWTNACNAQTYSVLHTFTNNPDGTQPYAGLTVSGTTLFGTTRSGGSADSGMLFKINTDGTGFAVLKNFDKTVWGETGYTNSGGRWPLTDLVLNNDTLYGTTSGGGQFGFGTIFSIKTNGLGFTVLKDCDYGIMSYPNALTLDGATLYGTTYGFITGDGSMGCGTVYRINVDGTGFTVLKSFLGATNNGSGYANSDGAYPVGGVALSGGILYGTTRFGGTNGHGTVFKLGKDGTQFTSLTNFVINYSDLLEPQAGLVVAGSTLYGTAPSGNRYGTVFKLTTDGGGLTCFNTVRTNGVSYAVLTLSGNTLFGATRNGGASGNGVIFKINTDGTGYVTLKNFRGGNGSAPLSPVVLSDSSLYGTTYAGGSKGNGVLFKLDLASTPVVTIASHAVVSNRFYLTWNAILGEYYQVQYTTNLSQPDWLDAGSPITATNTVAMASYYNWFDQRRFYRVVYLP